MRVIVAFSKRKFCNSHEQELTRKVRLVVIFYEQSTSRLPGGDVMDTGLSVEGFE